MKLARVLACVVVSSTLLAGALTAGDLDWPEATSQNKPWSRWWWLGSIGTKQDFTAQMETYARAGLGGLEITPIYGVRGEEKRFLSYLSPEWMQVFDHVLDEGQRLGLGIDMATGNGWPFGGPWVSPDMAARRVVTKSYALKAGETLAEPVSAKDDPLLTYEGQPRKLDIADLKDPVASNSNLQDLALTQVRFPRALTLQVLRAVSDKGDKVDLTDKVGTDGRLSWTAPQGNWALYAVFIGWHGKQVERAGPGGEGDVIDHFSTDALDRYLRRFDEAYVGHRANRLRAYFNDSYEVDDARGEANWTPLFFDEFKRRRGYDLRDELPAFFGKDNEDRNARVMSDHRETISDMLLENYTERWARWAAAHGALIRNQAHGSPANILDLYAASGIPETEGASVVGMKLASSAAHLTGKPLASAEVATWLDEHWLSTLGDIKRRVDLTFLAGINHMCYHGTAFSPPAERWPGFHFYAAVEMDPSNSIWADADVLNAYITRVQSLLQPNGTANDVLLYYPIHDSWARRGDGTMPHFGGGSRGGNPGTAQELLSRGYTFDYVSDRLLAGVKTTGRDLEVGGRRYRTVLVPEAKVMPVETVAALWKLAESGATIVFRGELPSDVPGLGRLEERRAELGKFAGQVAKGSGKSGVTTLSVGSGRVLVGNDLETLFAAAGVVRETLVDQGLQFERRSHEEGHLYFLVNGGDARFAGWVALATPAQSAVVFEPMTGVRGVGAVRKAADGREEIYIELDPAATCVLKTFAARRISGPAFALWRANAEPKAVAGPWSVRFVAGGPKLPAEAAGLSRLQSWTEFAGGEGKAFSGTALYKTTLNVAARGDYILDLGVVCDSARVRLNGREIAALIAAPWRTVITREVLREGDNDLEVAVTNVSANRIADLDRRDPSWKRFYNTNYPARRPENRGPDGNFTAARWTPRSSGLIGPVTLAPATTARPE